jgi:hypothetical protein
VVGTYACCGYGPAVSAIQGATTAGSNLRWACCYNGLNPGEAGFRDPAAGTPAGNWQLMGQIGYSINNSGVYNVNSQRNVSVSMWQRYA